MTPNDSLEHLMDTPGGLSVRWSLRPRGLAASGEERTPRDLASGQRVIRLIHHQPVALMAQSDS
ncbi:MAG: hypothetical protein EOM20_18755 [Spartobacteria bacterium]|nr:hypothetical protein [Spartobacteria bacterium]